MKVVNYLVIVVNSIFLSMPLAIVVVLKCFENLKYRQKTKRCCSVEVSARMYSEKVLSRKRLCFDVWRFIQQQRFCFDIWRFIQQQFMFPCVFVLCHWVSQSLCSFYIWNEQKIIFECLSFQYWNQQYFKLFLKFYLFNKFQMSW